MLSFFKVSFLFVKILFKVLMFYECSKYFKIFSYKVFEYFKLKVIYKYVWWFVDVFMYKNDVMFWWFYVSIYNVWVNVSILICIVMNEYDFMCNMYMYVLCILCVIVRSYE